MLPLIFLIQVCQTSVKDNLLILFLPWISWTFSLRLSSISLILMLYILEDIFNRWSNAPNTLKFFVYLNPTFIDFLNCFWNIVPGLVMRLKALVCLSFFFPLNNKKTHDKTIIKSTEGYSMKICDPPNSVFQSVL